LHQQAHSGLGKANDVQSLGMVYMQQDKLDKAEASFQHAIELHQQAHYVLGEAYDVQNLGKVYMQQNKLDEAEVSFEHALELHQQAHSVLGKANDVKKLGEVYMQQNKLDKAKASFEHAIELHQQAHDVLGKAYDVQNLGEGRPTLPRPKGFKFTATQVKTQWGRFKEEYKIVKELKSLSSFGWDEDKKVVTAEKDVWERYCLGHPKAKPFQKQAFLMFDQIAIIISDTSATGAQALSSLAESVNALVTSVAHDSPSTSTPVMAVTPKKDRAFQVVCEEEGLSPHSIATPRKVFRDSVELAHELFASQEAGNICLKFGGIVNMDEVEKY
ncbi:hypothetical protein DXG01_003961, partial [Tephrocybe rancida]